MKEEILKRIDALAEKLGVTADKIWAILVAQARVEFWASIMWFVIGVAGTVLFLRVAYRKGLVVTDNLDKGPDLPNFFVALLSLFAGVAFAVCALANVSMLTQLINPEYWALQQVLEVLGK